MMTRHADLKRRIRARMRDTGENYTSARAALLAHEVTRPEHLSSSVTPADAPAPSALPAMEAIDPVAARAAHERLLRGAFTTDGRLVQIPRRRRARTAVLLETIARFEPGRLYMETEVGDVLGALHEDVAYLRRELVDYGYLQRDPAGTVYRLTDTAPLHVGNAAQEVTDWEQIWLPRFLAGTLAPREELD